MMAVLVVLVALLFVLFVWIVAGVVIGAGSCIVRTDQLSSGIKGKPQIRFISLTTTLRLKPAHPSDHASPPHMQRSNLLFGVCLEHGVFNVCLSIDKFFKFCGIYYCSAYPLRWVLCAS